MSNFHQAVMKQTMYLLYLSTLCKEDVQESGDKLLMVYLHYPTGQILL